MKADASRLISQKLAANRELSIVVVLWLNQEITLIVQIRSVQFRYTVLGFVVLSECHEWSTTPTYACFRFPWAMRLL